MSQIPIPQILKTNPHVLRLSSVSVTQWKHGSAVAMADHADMFRTKPKLLATWLGSTGSVIYLAWRRWWLHNNLYGFLCKWTNWELVEAWCSGWGGGIHERLMESSNTKINLSPGWSEGGGRSSEKTAEDCWLDTEFKLLTLKWNCSHVDMTSRKRLRLEPCQFERCVQFFTW